MLELRERVTRRLALLGPGPVAFYTDACLLIDNVQNGTWPLRSGSNLVSHLLRELESNVRSVLYFQLVETTVAIPPQPPADFVPDVAAVVNEALTASQAQSTQSSDDCDGELEDGSNHRQQLVAIFKALEFEDKSAESLQWRALVTGSQTFTKMAHRDALNAPRMLDAQFIDRFEIFSRLLDCVLDRFEARYSKVYDQLDSLLAAPFPTRDQIRLLKNAVPNTSIALTYFFERLEHIGWIDPLRAAGYFKTAPAATRDLNRNTIEFDPWPALVYLAKMAPIRPGAVAEIVRVVPDTDNVRACAQLLDVLLLLRREDRKAMACRVEGWVQPLATYYWGDQCSRFALALLQEEAIDEALSITERLLRLPKDWRTAAPRPLDLGLDAEEQAWHLRDLGESFLLDLAQASTERTVDVVAGALNFHAGRRIDDLDDSGCVEEGLSDHSTFWTDQIPHQTNDEFSDLRVYLANALHRIMMKANATSFEHFSVVLSKVRNYNARVLRRIEFSALLHALKSGASETRDATLQLVVQRLQCQPVLHESELDEEVRDLLATAFPMLHSIDQQRVLDAFVPPTFDWMKNESNAAHRRQQWRRDRLALIAANLPAKERGELRALVASLGEPMPIERHRVRVTSGAGEPSPLDDTSLRGMSLEELLGFLNAWHSNAANDNSWRNGLAGQIRAMVAEDPTAYREWPARFVGQHAAYVDALLDGFRFGIHANKAVPWEQALVLAEWAIEQPVPDVDVSESGQRVAGYEWRDVRRIVADLIGLGLPKGIPFTERARVWGIISSLIEDVEPSPEYEKRYGGKNMNANSIANNTVRPQAIDAAIRFAFWSAQNRAEVGANLREVLVQEADVADVIERHLDPKVDRSLAVRSVIGQWLTPLARTDAQWVESRLPLMLPTEVLDAALRSSLLEGWLRWSQPHPEALRALQSVYELAITEAKTTDDQETKSEDGASDRLGEHLATLYWWGAIGIDEPTSLIAKFFLRASVKHRAHAIHFLGVSLNRAKDPLDGDLVDRMQRFWNWRAPQLIAVDTDLERTSDAVKDGASLPTISAADARRELSEFGWWFASGQLGSAWALDRLEEVLQISGDVEGNFAVVKKMTAVSANEPKRVAACLLQVDFTGGGKSWTVRSWLQELPAMLRPALNSEDPNAVSMAREVVNRVVAAGHSEHRVLLR